MKINGTGMSIERRQFLRRTLQAAAATQLGWVAACGGPQTGGAGGGVSSEGEGKQGFRSTEWLGGVTLSPQQMRDMQAGS